MPIGSGAAGSGAISGLAGVSGAETAGTDDTIGAGGTPKAGGGAAGTWAATAVASAGNATNPLKVRRIDMAPDLIRRPSR